MRKVTAQIYGRKYIFETDIEEDFLNGLIQTFSKKRVRQTPQNFCNFCMVRFGIAVKFVDNLLTFNVIQR